MMTPVEVDFVETQDRMLLALFRRDELSKSFAKMTIQAGTLQKGVNFHIAQERVKELETTLRAAEEAFNKAITAFRQATDKLMAERNELEMFLTTAGEPDGEKR